MAWGDKAVSPVVYTPAAADASGWALDDGLVLLDGKITTTYPRLNLICELLAKNYVVGSTDILPDTSSLARQYVQAGPTLKPTFSGGRLYFDGSNDSLASSAGSIAVNAPSRLTMYIKYEISTTNGDATYRFLYNEGSPSYVRLGIVVTSYKRVMLSWRDDDGDTKTLAYENEADLFNKKNVLAITRSNTEQKLFINGVLKATGSVLSGNIKTSDISIVVVGGYNSYILKGYFDKLLAYNSIHTEAQVADISAILAATT